ncbi:ATP-binding protein [Acidipropionibacterium jensenii]|uniref:ATP-binding protein n=1 Tax=Acidipropionibacterium jensenii TaxID=1749 RepID=UPI000687BBE1|nr:BTAD domain-containing putative transcriptional regulator [Acidipropionibacterium jensenii]
MNEASTPRCRAGVLGPVVVESAAGDLVELGGATSRALLVCLVLSHGPRSLRGIVDEIWQDAPPRNEKAALQTLVSRVRATASAGLIVSTPGGYLLAAAPEECDLTAAQQARDAGRADAERAGWPAVVSRTADALALWRGQPGADLGDTELADRLADLSGELFRSLTVLHARGLLGSGDGAGALAELEPLAQADPLSEEIEILRLRAIMDSGASTDALREFERFRRALREELGADPSSRLLDLQTELLESCGNETRRTLRVGIRSTPNVLLGRSDDIAALEELMAGCRLTTILGIGGLGKTRLAQELAARATEHTPGVVVVELAGVRTGWDVPLALASTLGIREYSGKRSGLSDPAVQGDVRARILRALDERPTLLVIDNCEHIIDDVARWVDDILSTTRTVRVLATSRAPLMIAAEQVYQLQPLASCGGRGDQGPAVRLFIDRARAARPSVALPAPTLSRLCDRLDGLPLAIELAAARVRAMSVEEIERRIGDRFSLLRGGDRTAPERHRTLLAVIDWSWNLLSPSEQRSLRRLSAFADGFGAGAARAVAGSHDIDADLEGLVNQSLLTASDVPRTGHVRYRMLETVREFAGHRLELSGESAEVEVRVRDWADSFSRRALPTTYGPGQLATFRAVEEEQDNLVAVLHHAVSVHDAAVVASIFSALSLHWMVRGAHSEVTSLSADVLELLRNYRPDREHRDQTVLALGLIGGTSLMSGVRPGMRALARMRALAAQHPPRDPQLAALVELMGGLPRLERVVAVAERQRSSAIPVVSAVAHLLVCQVYENSGEVEAALAEGLAAYQKARIAEDGWATGTAAQGVAQLYGEMGRPERVQEWVDRCRPHLERLNATEDLLQVDWTEAMSDVALGRRRGAEEVFNRLVVDEPADQDHDAVNFRALGFISLAEVAVADGDLAGWQRYYSQAEQVWGAGSPGPGSWWYSGAASGALVAAARNGTAPDPDAARIARRVRRRLVLADRVRPAVTVDRPMIGLAALGLAVWLLAPERRPDAALRAVAQEILALAHAVGARQNFPSLSWGTVTALVLGWHPDLDLTGACRRAGRLTMVERGGAAGRAGQVGADRPGPASLLRALIGSLTTCACRSARSEGRTPRR